MRLCAATAGAGEKRRTFPAEAGAADARSSAMTSPRRRPKATLAGDAGDLSRCASSLLAGAGIAVVADPDAVVVLLLSSPAARRVDAVAALVAERPGARLVVAMPDDARTASLRGALRAGAHGIVLDGELDRTLVPAVVSVASGQLSAPLALQRQLAPAPLSFRERQILALVTEGNTNRQIADRLVVAESTVKTHLSSAFEKLEVRSRAEAAALFLDPDEGYAHTVPELRLAS
jgi:DNA-binding NarL/FixJ family response regulator